MGQASLLALAIAASWGVAAQDEAEPKQDTKAKELSTVTVRGKRVSDPTTEGTESYTTDSITFGGKVPVSVLEVPNSVSVITRQRIEDQNLVSSESALREVTGVTVTPWDGATSQIRSRGYNLEASYDGIPAYGALSAYQQFDLTIYDRVEVLRGPGGIFQGSSQPGGVANFVRKRGRNTFAGSAVLSAGSWSSLRGELDLGGPLTADARLRSRVALSTQDRGFFYDDAESRKHLFYGTLDYDLGENTIASLSFTRQRDEVNPYMGQPAYTDGRFLDVPRSTNVYPDWVIQKWDKDAVAFDLEHAFGNGWSLKGRLGRQTQDWYYKDSYPTGGVNPDTGTVATYARRQSDSDTERTGLDLFAAGPFELWGRRHHALVGLNHEEYETVTLYGTGAAVPNVSILDPNAVEEIDIAYATGSNSLTRQSGLYGQLRLSLSGSLVAVAGGRWSDFEARNRRVPPQTPTDWVSSGKADGEFTPYAGLIHYLRDNITAYASYADTFIPQTQLKFSGEAIDPRIGKQYEIGTKASLHDGRLNLSAAAFKTNDINRAYPDTANPGYFLQAGEVEVKGWELEASGSPLRNLDLTAGYTQLRTRYLAHQTFPEGELFSLFEPRHTFKLFANYRFEGAALHKLSAGGGLHVSSGTIGTGVAGVREQHGYAVASLHLGYRFHPRLRATLAVNNVFDRDYYERVGGLNSYNTPGEPRNVLVALRSSF